MKNKELLICECHNIEHQITFIYDDGDECKNVYMYIHLTKKSFWERLKYGLKYILGYQCRFGAFDEMILNPNDSDKIQKVLNYLRMGYLKEDSNKDDEKRTLELSREEAGEIYSAYMFTKYPDVYNGENDRKNAVEVLEPFTDRMCKAFGIEDE